MNASASSQTTVVASASRGASQSGPAQQRPSKAAAFRKRASRVIRVAVSADANNGNGEGTDTTEYYSVRLTGRQAARIQAVLGDGIDIRPLNRQMSRFSYLYDADGADEMYDDSDRTPVWDGKGPAEYVDVRALGRMQARMSAIQGDGEDTRPFNRQMARFSAVTQFDDDAAPQAAAPAAPAPPAAAPAPAPAAPPPPAPPAPAPVAAAAAAPAPPPPAPAPAAPAAPAAPVPGSPLEVAVFGTALVALLAALIRVAADGAAPLPAKLFAGALVPLATGAWVDTLPTLGSSGAKVAGVLAGAAIAAFSSQLSAIGAAVFFASTALLGPKLSPVDAALGVLCVAAWAAASKAPALAVTAAVVVASYAAFQTFRIATKSA